MKAYIMLLLALLFWPIQGDAKPNISIKNQRSNENLAQIKITNNTTKALICHIAIDGHKIRFRLPPRLPSQWYQATDTRFNYTHFSTWCDYLSLYPQYQ